ncbi:MAG TPA: DNRLRE domain-containing protein [Candidatus Saccharibacteria bacterium]|nr:DNRLRE domain-containing protein [Candidatus Saccharibacteria bacterium]
MKTFHRFYKKHTNAMSSLLLLSAGAVVALVISSSLNVRALDTTFYVTEDTTISAKAPNATAGGDVKTVVCGAGTSVCSVDSAAEKRSLFKFNVTGLTEPVVSAKLRLYALTSSVPSLSIQRVTGEWSETTATWNNAGGLQTSGDVFTTTAGAKAGWYEATITSAITGDGTYGFVVTTPSSVTTRLSTKEATNTSLRAQLIVTTQDSTEPPAQVEKVVAAGDISTKTLTGGNKKTADLIKTINPDRVLTLGDGQYDSGSLADYTKFFGATWGQFKDKIYPSVGHHDYYTDTTASGYFSYFGDRATPLEPGCRASCKGYYSFDSGNWHFVALNTNHKNSAGVECSYLACGAGSEQLEWLASDLAANTKPCTLAYWSDPRWSSGTKHGDGTHVAAIWQLLDQYNVDIALNGHEHFYERFDKQDANRNQDPQGTRQFTVGTGGNGGLYPFGTPKPNSQVRYNGGNGVLELDLSDSGYDWTFRSIAGLTFTDSGSGSCNP